jgi:hypothetical protein
MFVLGGLLVAFVIYMMARRPTGPLVPVIPGIPPLPTVLHQSDALYSLGVFALWGIIFLLVSVVFSVPLALLPDSIDDITRLSITGVLGFLTTLIILWKTWSHWTISPDNLEIWYTLNRFPGMGNTRFFRQGTNFKFPWETRIFNDHHNGVINLKRMITVEDAASNTYIAKLDGSPVAFDWKFEVTPWALNDDGSICYEGCLAYIQTDNDTKVAALRAILEQRLTQEANAHSSEELRDQTHRLTGVIANVFLGRHMSTEEIAHGVKVSIPVLIGVLDSPEVQEARKTAKRLQVIAAQMQKKRLPVTQTPAEIAAKKPLVYLYEVDDDVLLAAGLANRNEYKLTGNPATGHLVFGNTKI